MRLGNGSGERRRKEDDGKSREVEVELHVEELEGCSDIYTFVEGLRFAKNGVKIGRSRVAVGMLCRQRSCYFDGWNEEKTNDELDIAFRTVASL